MSLEHIDLLLPRHAFSARDTARAGEVWRTFQDAAVIGSSRCGWSPQRYTAEQCAFVVRQQTVVHHREMQFGEAVRAETWVESFKRGIFSTRQTRLFVGDERVGAATQDWVHVSNVNGRMRACRASADLLSSFQELAREPVVTLPAMEEVAGRPFTFGFTAWHCRMDPLDHANHPAYIDWCEEALAREVVAAGLKPVDVVPVAERVRYKAGVLGGDDVQLACALVGRTSAGDAVIDFTVRVDEEVKAEARLVRRMTSGSGDLFAILMGDD